MNNPVTETSADHDVVDRLVGLQSGSATYDLRHQRKKVVAATQGSYDTLFDPSLAGISLNERLLVALYACCLSGAATLAAHYRDRLTSLLPVPTELTAVETDAPDQLPDGRLRAMLLFTRALTQRPVEGDQAALQSLPAVGISTPAVVVLAQLIAFISYQVRVVASLKAMQDAAQLSEQPA
ncbi:CMD domain-containing protein [Glaciimonas sp. PAMC28666]|uniref:CMD domain-containing protein n=1 Tax=Glaciimonas sp. PAMC28666 TaxID=2807626 RepID=UPI0019641F93|nr:CMD domain protein [Glaciimonas sp. PAMC28666]QRX82013.1 CMD domain protein [Glaciimonas sp. PAMC28666]